MANGHGGTREGAGAKLGSHQAHTLAKRSNREAIRKLVEAELAGIVCAQVLHAKGVSYMRLRNPDGSFARATDEKQIDAAIAAGATWFQIFTEAPNTQAANTLLGYVADKPVEPHEITGEDGGPLKVIVELPE